MAKGHPLDIASTMVGKLEGRDRAAVTEYLKTGGVNLDPATTAWCAAFVNSTLKQAGYPTTGSNLAKSFLNYGTPEKQPQAGDIAVYPRGDPKGPYGHVGFVQSYDPATGNVMLLAGNQGNSVSAKPYAMSKALGFRRLPDANAAAVEPAAPQRTASAGGPGGGTPTGEAPSAANMAGPTPAAQYASSGGGPGGGTRTGEAPTVANGGTAPASLVAGLPFPDAPAKRKDWRDMLASSLAGMGKGFAALSQDGGQRPDFIPQTAPSVALQAQPIIDPATANNQRQQMAQALARLNSGQLYG